MKVNIDLDILIEHYMTPDDYIFLWGLYTNFDLSACELYPNYVPLEEKGLIKIGEDYILTNEGKDIFEPKGVEAKFLEFWNHYPIHVNNGQGGKRALRASDSDTKQGRTCKSKYELILRKNPNIHNNIMKGLSNYIKNTKLQYVVGVEVFLNQELWDKWVGEEKKGEDGDDI
jgi:hypothetical protein